jgi:hypothetical protein
MSTLTQTPPQPIIIKHKQLTEKIPVSDWIYTANRTEKDSNSLL